MRTPTATRRPLTRPAASEHARTWLAEQFPEWDITVRETSSWNGDARPLFMASRDGHHPQSELSPGRLHTRLEEYLARRARKEAMSN